MHRLWTCSCWSIRRPGTLKLCERWKIWIKAATNQIDQKWRTQTNGSFNTDTCVLTAGALLFYATFVLIDVLSAALRCLSCALGGRKLSHGHRKAWTCAITQVDYVLSSGPQWSITIDCVYQLNQTEAVRMDPKAGKLAQSDSMYSEQHLLWLSPSLLCHILRRIIKNAKKQKQSKAKNDYPFLFKKVSLHAKRFWFILTNQTARLISLRSPRKRAGGDFWKGDWSGQIFEQQKRESGWKGAFFSFGFALSVETGGKRTGIFWPEVFN